MVGGPVDERSGREPRAHRFQAVESTSAAKQLSPFAGQAERWWPQASVGSKGPAEVVGVVETFTQIRATACDERNFGRALQLRIRNHADDDEVLGERKRKGLRNAIGTQICFGSCVALIPATKKTQVTGASPSAFGSALRPVCSFSAHSQEMGVRSSNRSGTHGSPPRISGRKLAARGNSRWPTPSRARRWPAQWTRACVVCSCRSHLAVRGSRCRPALSVGRRRDLAFGSLAPPSHRKGRRAKGSRMI